MKPTKTPQEKFKAGLRKSGYDPEAGARRLLNLLAKQKKEREEFESKYKSAYEGREMKTLAQIIEGTVVMSDYKLDKRGRKYRAHRATIGRDAEMNNESIDSVKLTTRKNVKEDVNPYNDLEEGMGATLRKFVPGLAKHQLKKKMDAQQYAPGDSAKRTVDKDVNYGRYKKLFDKTNEDVELDEARGRPAGAATLAKRAAAAAKPRDDDDESEHYDADSGVEADQHIHVQLKKAADSDQKPFQVSFKNGKKHAVSQKVAKDVLSATERLKPEHRKNVHDEIHQSYDNLMSVHRLVARD